MATYGIPMSKLEAAIKRCEAKRLTGSADEVSEALLKLCNLLKEDGNNLTLVLLSDDLFDQFVDKTERKK